ncbi:MAG: holo-ACP synthase [Actinomycetota bacterium]|nr:holo-ACP synthase [Actinomycetota bacterium]
MRIVGIGVDVVEVDRVRGILDRRPGFGERVFTPEEVARCNDAADPPQCLAARWAAREAAVKALGGVPRLAYTDITVEVGDEGSPTLTLSGAARERADELGADRVLVSLSHERSLAAAFCIAVGD